MPAQGSPPLRPQTDRSCRCPPSPVDPGIPAVPPAPDRCTGCAGRWRSAKPSAALPQHTGHKPGTPSPEPPGRYPRPGSGFCSRPRTYRSSQAMFSSTTRSKGGFSLSVFSPPAAFIGTDIHNNQLRWKKVQKRAKKFRPSTCRRESPRAAAVRSCPLLYNPLLARICSNFFSDNISWVTSSPL